MLIGPPTTAIDPSQHDTAIVMDLFVLTVTTYMTYTRFPTQWKLVLFNFYFFFIIACGYCNLQGLVKPDAGLQLRALNAMLCFLNLILDESSLRRMVV